jgi:hypothetical protein
MDFGIVGGHPNVTITVYPDDQDVKAIHAATVSGKNGIDEAAGKRVAIARFKRRLQLTGAEETQFFPVGGA